ncbi:MAG: bifunctional aldolase/short-chain dehydrogenase [Thermodesulfobacteriota bacterium]
MRNLYDENEARAFVNRCPDLPEELASRIYTSRLLGGQKDLVRHGGGNTSVKLKAKDVLGRDRDVLYVKASGVDLAVIGPEGFTALDLAALTRLRDLDLAPEELHNQLLLGKLQAAAADPSLDVWAHAYLRHPYVDHTHADSVLILTNQKQGPELVREALGSKAAVLPYVRPGFLLGAALAGLAEAEPEAEALVVLGHGLFTFGPDARTAYARMIGYVSRAEDFLSRWSKPIEAKPPRPDLGLTARLAQVVRGACAYLEADGRCRHFLVELRAEPDLIAASLLPEAAEFCASGALTPDHVIRTKNKWVYLDQPAADDEALQKTVRAAVRDYTDEYGRYFDRQAGRLENRPAALDPYPRVFLAAALGLFALGRTRTAARVAADLAVQTLRAKVKARDLGGFEPLPEDHVFEMEYWNLQIRKLGSALDQPLTGQAALVTGGGGAIALGVADRLLAAGAAVVLADLDPDRLEQVRQILASKWGEERLETLVFDVTDYPAAAGAVAESSRRLGGLDIVVPNAGVAEVAAIENLDPDRLDRVMAVNYKGTFNLIKASAPVFRRQGSGGNIVIISSKNVFDPGASFAAYSASKAAAHQLGKIAALELAELGVRVNLINPDAVFGDERVSSKLWDLVGPDRMRSRGLDPAGLKEYYRQRNLLKAAVLAEHVGNAVVFFASDLTPTTGATLPVDGGVPGAFPR